MEEEKKPKTKNQKIVVLTVFLALALAALGVLGYLYYQKQTESTRLANNVSSLKKESTARQASTLKQPQEVDLAAKKGLEYSAKVGKFTLALPNGYGVIVKLDGPGEGGEATDLSVVKLIDGESSIYQATYLTSFELKASKVYRETTLDAIIKQASEGYNINSITDTTIDKKPAKIVTLGGLGITKKVIFLHNDISYVITFDGDNPQGQAFYDDVARGFTFN